MSEQVPVTDSPVERGARAAARRLASEHRPGLEAEVEAALYARGTDRRPEQYFDPISLGSLIVSVATLAWTVYRDLHKKTPKPAREVIARRVRVELPASNETPPAVRDQMLRSSWMRSSGTATSSGHGRWASTAPAQISRL